MYKKLTVFFWLVLTASISFATDTITIHPNMYQIDHTKKLVVVNQSPQYINTQWTDIKTTVFLNEFFHFDTPVPAVNIGIGYTVKNSLDIHYTLYFTELPIIHISTNHTIQDEPEVHAMFSLIESNENITQSNIGIEIRGGWSQNYPKKSYRIEFWNDSLGLSTRDVSLLNMRSDDDWNLQALYNEPLRLRSKTNNDLWLQIHNLYYQAQEPEAVCGIRMEFVELFLNGEYNGVYALSERIDRKQLKLKKYNGNIRGELYKGVHWAGAATFSSFSSYDNTSREWSSFEYDYPDEITDWHNLHDFVRFVITANNSTFYSNYAERFDENNAVDYFIFLNLLRATDNTGKNLFIARYNANEPYFYVPWDLDGSFGTIWNGNRDYTYDDILFNGFYKRLANNCDSTVFVQKLQQRWNGLRSGIITHDSIMSMFQRNHQYLLENAVYEREEMAWSGFTYDIDHITYMSQWLAERLNYLDSAFNGTCIPLNIANNETPDLLNIYPNPTRDYFTLKLSENITYPIWVEIYNMNGQHIQKMQLFAPETYVDISSWHAGVYYVRLSNSVNSTFKKLVIY